MEDNETNEADTYNGRHRIWHGGSSAQIRKTMFGGANIQASENDPMSDFVNGMGIFKPIITMGGFLISALAAQAGRSDIAMWLSRGTILIDGIYNAFALADFLRSDDPGAILGFGFNTLFGMLMYSVVFKVMQITGSLRAVFNGGIGGKSELTSLFRNSKALKGFAEIVKILAIFNVILMTICNPKLAIYALIHYLVFASVTGDVKDKAVIAILLPIAIAMARIYLGYFSDGDPLEDVIDGIDLGDELQEVTGMIQTVSSIPYEIIGFLFQGIGLGVMLGFSGGVEKGEAGIEMGPFKSAVEKTNLKDATGKAVKWYSLYNSLMFAISMGVYFERTGMRNSFAGMFLNTAHDEGGYYEGSVYDEEPAEDPDSEYGGY